MMTPPRRLVGLCAPALLAVGVVFPGAAQTRPFTAEDMLELVRISGPTAVSPGGDLLAYLLPDVGEDRNVLERFPVGTVYLQRVGPAGSAQPTPLTSGARWSSFPAFSPDGQRLAFFAEGEAGGRLAIWDASTGEVETVSAPFGGKATSAPQWADDDHVVYSRPAAALPAPAPPRIQVIESSDEILPGDAYFANRGRAGLAVVELTTGIERRLLVDDQPLRSFSVGPGGQYVLAAIASPETAGLPRRERNETHIWTVRDTEPGRTITDGGERLGWLPDGRVYWRERGSFVASDPHENGPAEGGTPTRILEEVDLPLTNLVWSPSGSHFASLIRDSTLSDPEIEAPQPGMYTIARPFMDLFVVSADGVTLRNVTADIDDQINSPVWSQDGSTLFFRAVDNATYEETLFRFDIEEERRTEVTSGPESYANLNPVSGGLFATVESATAPPDVWRADEMTGKRTQITELNPQLSEFRFSEPSLFHFESEDGDQLGAILYKPTGIPDDAKAPVITYVYEKLTPGIHRFSARQQIFATHGYGVLMPNVKVKVGETGTSFVNSVVPAVDAVEAMGFTNGRFCLWGGSFGAYATSFVITQTTIFDCAVSRATPPELFRNWASGRDRDSDNIERGQARMGGSPFEVMERYLSQSAFFHLDQVETPVLIMHGVEDYTILFGEGEMMFYALRRLGKVATFVVYKEGDHSLYRHSRADALDVHNRMLEWFDRHLRAGG